MIMRICVLSFLIFNLVKDALAFSPFSSRQFDLRYSKQKVAILECEDDQEVVIKLNLAGVGRSFLVTLKQNVMNPEGQVFFGRDPYTHKESLPIAKLASLCDGFRFRSTIDLSLESYLPIVESLKEVLPICQNIQPQNRRFHCQMPKLTHQTAVQQLKKIRQKVVRWSRQPYYLMRRVEMTQQLLTSIQTKNKSRTDVCGILKQALRLENPYSFQNEKWQKAFCSATEPSQRHSLGMVAVQSALWELEFLTKLSRKETHIGLYKARVDKSAEGYTKRLWVQLRATSETLEDFYEDAHLLLQEELPYTGPWHPIFGSEWYPGRSYGQTSNKSIGRYSWDSLVSESEFLISNWRSKMLRLPQGTYTYRVFATQNQPFEVTKNILDVGDLEWKRGRSVQKAISRR